MRHFVHGHINIVVAVGIAVEKMFPGKIDAIRCHVPDIEFIVTFHVIGVCKNIDILKISEEVILQTKSDLHRRSAYQYLIFLLVLQANKMKILLGAKIRNAFNKTTFGRRRQIIKIGKNTTDKISIALIGGIIHLHFPWLWRRIGVCALHKKPAQFSQK